MEKQSWKLIFFVSFCFFLRVLRALRGEFFIFIIANGAYIPGYTGK